MINGRPPNDVIKVFDVSVTNWKGRMPCAIFNPHLPGEAWVDCVNLFLNRVHAILEVFSFYVNQFDYGLRIDEFVVEPPYDFLGASADMAFLPAGVRGIAPLPIAFMQGFRSPKPPGSGIERGAFRRYPPWG
jgi:hypothetical protein